MTSMARCMFAFLLAFVAAPVACAEDLPSFENIKVTDIPDYHYVELTDEAGIFSQTADQLLARSMQDFKQFYYAFVLDGGFPENYANNLMLPRATLDDETQYSCVFYLRLIAHLSASPDHDSYLLLKKLTKVFYLQMHRHLVGDNLQLPHAQRAIQCLDTLYNHKVATPEGVVAPFRAPIAKAYLILTMVNHGQTIFKDRQETMMLHLNKLGHELHHINQQLGAQKIDNTVIHDLVMLLAAHQTRQPIIKTNYFRRIVLTALVLAAVVTIIYWKREWINQKVITPSIDMLRNLVRRLTEGLDERLTVLGHAVGSGAAGAAEQNLRENAAELRQNLVETIKEALKAAMDGLANDAAAQGQPLPDGQRTTLQRLAEVMGDTLGGALRENIERLVNEAAQDRAGLAPGQETVIQRLGQQLGDHAGDAIVAQLRAAAAEGGAVDAVADRFAAGLLQTIGQQGGFAVRGPIGNPNAQARLDQVARAGIAAPPVLLGPNLMPASQEELDGNRQVGADGRIIGAVTPGWWNLGGLIPWGQRVQPDPAAPAARAGTRT